MTSTIFRRILVGTDGSQTSRAACEMAVGLALAFRSAVRFVCVVDEERLVSDFSMGTKRDVGNVVECLTATAHEVLEEARQHASGAGVEADAVLLEGDVVDRILEAAAEWRADIIVTGTHARPQSLHPSLGSKVYELLRRSTLPVLVCR